MAGGGAARRAATRASRAMVSRFWASGTKKGAGTGGPKSRLPATGTAADENMTRIVKYELKINHMETEKSLEKFKSGVKEDIKITALEKKNIELGEKLEKEIELRKSSELKLVQQINAAASSAQVELIKGVMGLVAFTAMTCTGLANFSRLSSYFKKLGGEGAASTLPTGGNDKTGSAGDSVSNESGGVAGSDGDAATTD